MARIAKTTETGSDAAQVMSVMLRKIAGFSGLVHENMYRAAGWQFLSIGRSLERAAMMTDLLAAVTGPHLAARRPRYGDRGRRQHHGPSPTLCRVHQPRKRRLTCWRWTNANPRSVRFQLDVIAKCVDELSSTGPHGQMTDVRAQGPHAANLGHRAHGADAGHRGAADSTRQIMICPRRSTPRSCIKSCQVLIKIVLSKRSRVCETPRFSIGNLRAGAAMIYDIKLQIAYQYANPAVGGRHVVCVMPLDMPGPARAGQPARHHAAPRRTAWTAIDFLRQPHHRVQLSRPT